MNQHSRAPLILAPGRGEYTTAEPPNGPRLDFAEMARALGALVSYPDLGRGALGRLGQTAPWIRFFRQAWEARARDPQLVLSLSEEMAACFALINTARVPQVVVAHNLTTQRRRGFQRRIRWLNRIDRVIVLCQSQARYLLEDEGLPADRVRFIHDSVDHRFFSPQGGADEGYVLSVGREQRDYAALISAVEHLGAPTVILSSSRWSRHDLDVGHPSPHIDVRSGASDQELRRLYDRCSLVVVPLHPGVKYAAGVNAVLEAMAMRKPVVASATPGIADYVADGDNARVVPPADPLALQAVISELLSDSAQAQRLASNGRAFVDARCNLDAYVKAVVDVASELLVP